MTCPYLYQEKYEKEGTGLEKISKSEIYTPLQFGAREHELLEEHYLKECINWRYPPSGIDPLEVEAVEMINLYKAHYPAEEFEVVDVEHVFRLPIPNSHHFAIGKIDLTVRSHITEHLDIIDHKTQNRSSKSNQPQKWAARAQASLYLWAERQLRPNEQIDNFYVNILVRQSPAGEKPPYFPDRQKLERTQEQIDKALLDLATIADTIELYRQKFGDKPWPSSTEQCYTWGECEFYLPHTYGWSDEIRKTKFKPREEYLQIKGIGEIG